MLSASHFKAGRRDSNLERRQVEANMLKNKQKSLDETPSVIIAGQGKFNIYNASEGRGRRKKKKAR